MFLGDIYVIEDGFLTERVIRPENKSLVLNLKCPLFKSHPDYKKFPDFFLRFFSSGVYLNRDGREIELVFSGCESIEINALDCHIEDDLTDRIRSWGLEDDDKKTFRLETDAELMKFSFKSLEVFEIGDGDEKRIYSI